MESLLQDLRYAFRTLAKAPGFTVTAVITLALGVGAAAATFTLLSWVRLRPLPDVQDPASLGLVWFAVRTPDGGFRPSGLTAADRDGLLAAAPSLKGLSGEQIGSLTLAESGSPARMLRAEFVMGDYFSVLGATPFLGRTLLPGDDIEQGGFAAVISDEVWRSTFGSRPDIVGQPVRFNGFAFTIVGVMPSGFVGVERLRPTDVWVPGNLTATLYHAPRTQAMRYYEMVARLSPGGTFALADQQLHSALRPIVADTANYPSGETVTVFPGVGLSALGRDPIIRQVDLLMGIGILLLVITCANIANLLLFRAARRQGEAFVRRALGASRLRLARHLLSEHLLIGLAGGTLGMLTAWWLGDAFGRFRLLGFIRLDGMHADWRVFAFAVAVGIVAALASGLVSLFTPIPDLGTAIKTSGSSRTSTAPKVRAGLGAVQVAVSVTLVTGTLLMARTLQKYADVRLGFDPHGVLDVDVNPGVAGYSPKATATYLRTLVNRLSGVPGVESVALTAQIPFAGIRNMATVNPVDSSVSPVTTLSNAVSEDYFATLGIPILEGRPFVRGELWPDSGASVGAVILSQSLARQLFGTRDPVGGMVRIGEGRRELPAQVVGIAGDVHWNSLREDPDPLLYEPFGQGWAPTGAQVAVRAPHIPTEVLSRQIEDAGRALDPALPVTPWGSLSDAVASSLSTQTTLLTLGAILGALAVLLAAVGIAALVGYGVTLRTREFGIRMALGADGKSVIRTAIAPTAVVLASGTVIGLIGALYFTRFIALWLYGVSRYDPLSFGGAVLVLGISVLVASWIPARRAAAVDPLTALRSE
ncbi:MAG TPA: ADOP family duplicated permease [Gemmatimonadales bacterium]|nr:ADOP family duplicated permease [Gemmatimonadales bacterium]